MTKSILSMHPFIYTMISSTSHLHLQSCCIQSTPKLQHSPATIQVHFTSIHWLVVTLYIVGVIIVIVILHIGVFLNGPGAFEDSIRRQAMQYEAFKDEQRSKNPHAPQPTGDGVLIFDKVKVVSRLLWNSRCHRLGYESRRYGLSS